MSPDERTHLRNELRRLSPDDAVVELICSIVEMDRDALEVPLNLIGVAAIMAKQLRPDQRAKVCETMRATAALLEQRYPRPTFEARRLRVVV